MPAGDVVYALEVCGMSSKSPCMDGRRKLELERAHVRLRAWSLTGDHNHFKEQGRGYSVFADEGVISERATQLREMPIRSLQEASRQNGRAQSGQRAGAEASECMK
jgi:hypothetical protein